MNLQTIPVGNFTLTADADGLVGQMFLQNGFNYELHVRNEFKRVIPGCSGFLDIGSNIGFHVLSVKDIDANVPIAAFEPCPKNVSILCRNISANNLLGVDVFPVALGDCRRVIWFNADFDNPQPSRNGNGDYDNPWPCYPLTAFVLGFIPGVIKIDVEGMEFDVIKGLSHRMRYPPRPIIVMELNLVTLGQTHTDPQEMLAELLKYGYGITVLENKAGMRAGPFKIALDVIKHIQSFGENVADILLE